MVIAALAAFGALLAAWLLAPERRVREDSVRSEPAELGSALPEAA